MKKVVLAFLILMLSFENSRGQINWFFDFDLALKNAFKTGKKVLIECYHPECTHCKTLSENLKNETLANYFNDNYTNLQIDLSNKGQVLLLEKKNIRILNYPIFLFFDNGGNLYYFIEPQETPQGIIQQFDTERGNSCVDCEKKTDSSIKENVKCATYHRMLKDYEKSNAICNKFINELPEPEKSSQNSWNVFKKVILSTENKFFDFWINNLSTAAAFELNSNREKDVFFTIIQWQIKHLQNLSTIEKANIESIKSYLSILGGDKKRISTMLWDLELVFYLSQNDYKASAKICETLYNYYPDASTYNFLMVKINEKLASNELHSYFLSIKDKWFNAIKDDKQKKAFYLQAANFYGKNRDKNLFLENINLATRFGLSQKEKEVFVTKYL